MRNLSNKHLTAPKHTTPIYTLVYFESPIALKPGDARDISFHSAAKMYKMKVIRIRHVKLIGTNLYNMSLKSSTRNLVQKLLIHC